MNIIQIVLCLVVVVYGDSIRLATATFDTTTTIQTTTPCNKEEEPRYTEQKLFRPKIESIRKYVLSLNSSDMLLYDRRGCLYNGVAIMNATYKFVLGYNERLIHVLNKYNMPKTRETDYIKNDIQEDIGNSHNTRVEYPRGTCIQKETFKTRLNYIRQYDIKYRNYMNYCLNILNGRLVIQLLFGTSTTVGGTTTTGGTTVGTTTTGTSTTVGTTTTGTSTTVGTTTAGGTTNGTTPVALVATNTYTEAGTSCQTSPLYTEEKIFRSETDEIKDKLLSIRRGDTGIRNLFRGRCLENSSKWMRDMQKFLFDYNDRFRMLDANYFSRLPYSNAKQDLIDKSDDIWMTYGLQINLYNSYIRAYCITFTEFDYLLKQIEDFYQQYYLHMNNCLTFLNSHL